jgi:hypothetical protein
LKQSRDDDDTITIVLNSGWAVGLMGRVLQDGDEVDEPLFFIDTGNSLSYSAEGAAVTK